MRRRVPPSIADGFRRSRPSMLDRIRIDRTDIAGSIDPVNPVTIYNVEQTHAVDGIADGDSHQPRFVLGCSLGERVFMNTEDDFPYLTVHLRHELCRRTGTCLFENRCNCTRRHGGRVGRRQGRRGKGPPEERRRGRPGWVLTPPWQQAPHISGPNSQGSGHRGWRPRFGGALSFARHFVGFVPGGER